jgi:hypothetical protein
MGGYADFNEKLTNAAKGYIKQDYEQHHNELAQVLGNVIFERPGPRRVNRQANPQVHFFYHIWHGFIEIRGAYESLQDFGVYVSRFPFPQTRVGKTRYLTFMVESYLAEAYILKERLVAFLSKVGRLLRNNPEHAAIIAKTRPYFSLVSDSLKPLTDRRSAHTHEFRFDSPDLDRLRLLELLSSTGDDDELKEAMALAYRGAYRDSRKTWKETVENNNTEIGKLLDIYFEMLVELLFDGSGELRKI